MSGRLVRATPEEHQERDRISYEAWGARLTLEQYLERERRLRAGAWSRSALTGWLYRDADTVLSSCETYEMQYRLRGGRHGRLLAIASVFTEAPLRGRGYATAMLEALAELCRAERLGDALILFSDVGLAIYERAGFAAPSGASRYASLAPVPEGAGAPTTLDGVVPVVETDLGPGLAGPLGRVTGPLSIYPTPDQIEWHLLRERVYAEALGRRRPSAIGARAGAGLALWTADFKHERLEVLALSAETPAVQERLLAAAAGAAAEAELAEVRAWHLPHPASAGWRELVRQDELPMLRPLVPGIDADLWRAIPRSLWV